MPRGAKWFRGKEAARVAGSHQRGWTLTTGVDQGGNAHVMQGEWMRRLSRENTNEKSVLTLGFMPLNLPTCLKLVNSPRH